MIESDNFRRLANGFGFTRMYRSRDACGFCKKRRIGKSERLRKKLGLENRIGLARPRWEAGHRFRHGSKTLGYRPMAILFVAAGREPSGVAAEIAAILYRSRIAAILNRSRPDGLCLSANAIGLSPYGILSSQKARSATSDNVSYVRFCIDFPLGF